MSSYTMRLSEIVDDYTGGVYYANEREKIEAARKKIFNFDYPIFDPAYRKVFETNFIRKFYMREIGFETDGLFRFQLETWLLINMPYFNKMFESELIEFDPLVNSELDLTHTRKSDRLQNDRRNIDQESVTSGTGTAKSDGKSDTSATGNRNSDGSTDSTEFGRNLESNTPDSRLAITTEDGSGIIEYASKIDENTNKSNQNTEGNETSSSESNTVDSATSSNTAMSEGNAKQAEDLESKVNDLEDFVQHRIGKVGIQSYSEMLVLYRKSFVRIEQEMFKEMQELFMLVY